MLGQFNLFPYLKGWEYKTHKAERTSVIRGAEPIEARSVNESGWLLNIMLLTNDAYGTLRLEYQGQELQIQSFDFYPELGPTLGGFAQDPAGWMQRYTRPNPYSTLGIYVNVCFTGGTQGSSWPYIPTVRMNLLLPTDSTQASATIFGEARVLAITNRKAFIQSLRRILDGKASIEIDPGLLVTGPAELLKQVEGR